MHLLKGRNYAQIVCGFILTIDGDCASSQYIFWWPYSSSGAKCGTHLVLEDPGQCAHAFEEIVYLISQLIDQDHFCALYLNLDCKLVKRLNRYGYLLSSGLNRLHIQNYKVFESTNSHHSQYWPPLINNHLKRYQHRAINIKVVLNFDKITGPGATGPPATRGTNIPRLRH